MSEAGRGRTSSITVAVLVTTIAACAPPAPDVVLLNARVFAGLAGPATVRRDLGGRTVLPGLNDAHVTDPGLFDGRQSTCRSVRWRI
jgi:hypothetical protein